MRRPQRRAADPAVRAQLRGVGPPARRSVAVRAGHPDVLVRPRPHRARPASSSGRSRSRGSRRRRRSSSTSRSARATASPMREAVEGNAVAAAAADHDGVGRGRPQRAGPLAELVAVPRVADPGRHVVRARDRRHLADLDRADARDDRDGTFPDNHGIVAHRLRIGAELTTPWKLGPDLLDRSDARRPVRRRERERAGRRRARHREHPPRDARPRLDVGRWRQGHRRGPRAARRRDARRRGLRVEPHAAARAVLHGSPTT